MRSRSQPVIGRHETNRERTLDFTIDGAGADDLRIQGFRPYQFHDFIARYN